jgi:undecaprenyl-diphosphatase
MASWLGKGSGRKKTLWAGMTLGTAALLFLAGWIPFFPGDVAVARWIQSIAPSDPTWAQWLTVTAKTPWVFVLGGVGVVLSFLLAGWWGGILATVSFVGVRLGEPLLKAWIGRPRPSPQLVHVLEPATGFSLPSGLVLTYAATFGLLLFLALWTKARPPSTRWLIATGSLAMLLLGGVARITLGAHWPSDILLSYLLGGLWVSLLVRLQRLLA